MENSEEISNAIRDGKAVFVNDPKGDHMIYSKMGLIVRYEKLNVAFEKSKGDMKNSDIAALNKLFKQCKKAIKRDRSYDDILPKIDRALDIKPRCEHVDEIYAKLC